LKSAGANRVEFIDFSKTVSQMSPDEFVEVVVLGQLKANIVVIGQNFRFGAKASGNVETLQTLGNKFGFEVEVIELAGDSDTWSSTRIRTHLINGEVDLAGQLLGRPHRLVGEVVHGDHRGRELGYPTANMAVQDNVIIPADGVYSALMTAIEPVTNDKRIFPAAVSIGTNPTFEDVMERRVEAYAIGQENLDLYGQVITLDFIKAVRPMEKFAGITELLAAMASDISKATIQINDFLDSPSH
jgi:riboflavin kinase/FMN adenylyltransferase